MKTTRLRALCIKALANGPLCTQKVKDYVNNNSRHGTTMNSLVNVLGKDPAFAICGHEKTRNLSPTGNYNLARWYLIPNRI